MSEQEQAAELYLTYSRYVREKNPRYVLDWNSIKFWANFVGRLYK